MTLLGLKYIGIIISKFLRYLLIPRGKYKTIQECQSAKFLYKLEFAFDCCLNVQKDKRQDNGKKNRKMDKSNLLVSYTCKVSYTKSCLLQRKREALCVKAI